MSDSTQNALSDGANFVDILVDIRLTNVTEVKVLQEIISFIDLHYREHKAQIKPEIVAALILNRQDIPSLYATSPRGYQNQLLEFQNQFGISGYKIKQKLIPWAVDRCLRASLSKNLAQGLEQAKEAQSKAVEVDAQNFLELLGEIDLANVTEFQVIKEAAEYIRAIYPELIDRINLSDVCALVLNHKSVCSLYATSAEEYQKLCQVYMLEHQFQVNEIVQQMVRKIHDEGSDLSISHNSLLAVNFQKRKRIAQAW